jgi:hypothetical protein
MIKFEAVMATDYLDLKRQTDDYYSGKIDKKIVFGTALRLLKNQGIKLRQDDGRLVQLNISIPISRPKTIVLDLRYIKKDRTNSEDYFLFQNNKRIQSFYGRKLEKILPEYKGAHKIQLSASNLV